MGIPRIRPGGEQNHDPKPSGQGMLRNLDKLQQIRNQKNNTISSSAEEISIPLILDEEYTTNEAETPAEEFDMSDLSLYIDDDFISQSRLDALSDPEPQRSTSSSSEPLITAENIISADGIEDADESDLDELLGLSDFDSSSDDTDTSPNFENNSDSSDFNFNDFDVFTDSELQDEEGVKNEVLFEEVKFDFDEVEFDPFSADDNQLGNRAPLVEELVFEDFASPATPLESDFFTGFEDTPQEDTGTQESFSFDEIDFGDDIVIHEDEDFNNYPTIESDEKDFFEDNSEDFEDYEEEDEDSGDFGFDESFQPVDEDYSDEDPFKGIFEEVEIEEDESEDDQGFVEFEEFDNNELDSNDIEEETNDVEESSDKDDEPEKSSSIFGKLKNKINSIKNEVSAEMRGEEYEPDSSKLTDDEKNEKQRLRAEKESAEEDEDRDAGDSPKDRPKSGKKAPSKGGFNPFRIISSLYKSLAKFLFGAINTTLKILSSFPVIGRIFRPILSMTRLLERLALFMPALLLIIIFVVVQLVSVPMTTSSSLPDSGSAKVSSFAYDKESGSVSAVVKNTGNVIADVTVDFKVYKMAPQINPITWFVPKEITSCSSELIHVDIESSAEVSSSCDSVSGILVRATGKAVG